MKLALLIAGIASMRTAIEHRDVDEAARQGTLAGPAVVEKALRSHDRDDQLAGIAAAPHVEDRAELLDRLAIVAGGSDRRSAIPAARAAQQIARELGAHELPDDLAAEDLVAWHDAWLALAARGDRWIEVRTIALEVAAALGDVPLSSDPDPLVRIAAIEVQPAPASAQVRAALAKIVVADIDNGVALAAARVLCLDGDPIDAARLASLDAKCVAGSLR